MMSKLKLIFASASGWALTMQVAMAADPGTVPEPGSLALVGIAIAAAVVVAVRRKK